MLDGTNLIYRYDGSMEGLLCCIFESYEKKEMPCGISPQDEAQGTLFREKEITTDRKKAERVWTAIPKKISREAAELIRLCFLSCVSEKELLLLKFVRLGFHYGAKVTSMLTNDTVDGVLRAVKALQNESHQYKEFVRFSDYDGALVAVIRPKNQVLPLIAGHFCSRLKWESFMIYDKTHHIALVYREGKKEIVPVEELIVPEAGEEEQKYRKLWKMFYETIAIEGRDNPRCRMTHMPKRYWEFLTEFEEELVRDRAKNVMEDPTRNALPAR